MNTSTSRLLIYNAHLFTPNHPVLRGWLFVDSGVIRLLALAPEFEENLWLIAECVRRGITMSAAHTAANYEQMQRAAEHGVTQLIHITPCRDWVIVKSARSARR